MLKILFFFALLRGEISPAEGGLYTIGLNEFVCYGEALEYIRTGVFQYNDELCECGELE
jgi:hypothetical protein